jgi:DNA repair photolyase
MHALYQPSGKAAEYAHLAVNLFQSCSHGCKYCFAPKVLHKTDKEFHANVMERPGILDQLRQDAKKYAGTNARCLLCFTCDPYARGCDSTVTRAALTILRQAEIPFQVLTKGGLDAARDFDLYGPHDAFACTLTLENDRESRKWEPGAALPAEREEALRQAHARGITTWASLEPVIYGRHSLEWIRRTHEFVDHYKIGRLNYMPKYEQGINWESFGRAAVELLEKYGRTYWIKNSIAWFLDRAGVKYCNTDMRVVTLPEVT